MVPDDATEAFLGELFRPFGTPSSIKVYKNQWGKPKGDALVALDDAAAAKSAIKALNGKEVLQAIRYAPGLTLPYVPGASRGANKCFRC